MKHNSYMYIYIKLMNGICYGNSVYPLVELPHFEMSQICLVVLAVVRCINLQTVNTVNRSMRVEVGFKNT